MKAKNMLGNQSGFTLIEIIAVLIIIGILAAVAVPKYFELTTDAEQKAIAAAGAEVQARLNQHFANELLSNNGSCSAALGALTSGALDLNTLGDFTATLAAGGLNTSSGAETGLTLTATEAGYTGSYTINTPLCD
ncbi:MAG: prepilin-type N-terminal cleavage/methylation domain-containing protein [Desulfobacteraceae bacterium]|nr:prepilin-type N-terminal cleavage/methylation domain-containing protein [Desulfobacteraceae bacterium]